LNASSRRSLEMARFDQPIVPMTLGNMRELGVRAFLVWG
jgi:hypothetical protein